MSKDNNFVKSTLSGIRSFGLEPSTRSKMMEIAKKYTTGRKRKTTVFVSVAALTLGILGYSLMPSSESHNSSTNRRSSVQYSQNANTQNLVQQIQSVGKNLSFPSLAQKKSKQKSLANKKSKSHKYTGKKSNKKSIAKKSASKKKRAYYAHKKSHKKSKHGKHVASR